MDYLNAVYGVTYDPEVLVHYGRKGMKWYQHIFTSGTHGSRKRISGAKTSNRLKNPFDNDYPPADSTTATARQLYKNRSHYSTAELRAINDRKAAEATLKKYMQDEMPKPAYQRYANAGKAFIKGLEDTTKTISTIGENAEKAYYAYRTLTGNPVPAEFRAGGKKKKK